MRVYIESTIPSYVVARPARDLLQAGHQQITRDWWELHREKHELLISQIVLDEIGFGEKVMARRRLELVRSLTLLQLTEEMNGFARQILASGLLPPSAERDAVHIALASGHEMDILLSWNCRHIANAAIQARLRKLADVAGLILPVICTPEELMNETHEEDE